MSDNPNLLIFGASARAAAFSALRAGLQPWCADLFADADLAARGPAMRIPGNVYPGGFLRLARGELPGPWMYTGGLENHLDLVGEMEAARPLWGNGQVSLHICRTPWYVEYRLVEAGLPCPAVRTRPRHLLPARWLVKPLASAGGTGVHFWEPDQVPKGSRRSVYYQAYVEGTACAAVYLGDGRKARLLGVTRQLVGEPWLHAAPFHYCGSIGPLPLDAGLRSALERLGEVLTDGCSLRGLFGVDFILCDGVPWPVEVNPRYTASVELLEYAVGVPALALHRRVFDSHAPAATVPLCDPPSWLGKAILFARAPLRFPEQGPWQAVLREPPSVYEAPAFADIPRPGECIAAGRPVLTFFARGNSSGDCLRRLQQIAADLDRRLFG